MYGISPLPYRYGDTFNYISRKVLSLRKTEATQGTRSLFQLQDDQNETWTGRKVILATGIQDKLPAIPGFDAIWGRAVVHCVFCHGTETKNQPIAVLLDPSVGKMNGFILSMFMQKFKNLHNTPVTIIANGLFGNNATETKITPEFGFTAEMYKLTKNRG